MFSLQAGQLRNALVAAGLPAEHATKIAHVLGNVASEMRTGPVTSDVTPANLQQVDADTRRHQMPGFDPRSDDPYRPSASLQETEERAAAKRQSDVIGQQSVVSRQQATRDLREGAFLEIRPEGDSMSASLRVVGAGQHGYFDQQANQIVGKTFRAEVGNEDQYRIRLTVDEQDGETVWKAQLKNLVYIPVLTTLTNAEGVLTTGVRYAWVWVDEAAGYGQNPLVGSGTMRVITNVYWNGKDLVTNWADIPIPPGWTGGGGYGPVTDTGGLVGKGTKFKCGPAGCAVDPSGAYSTLADCKAACSAEQPISSDNPCNGSVCSGSLLGSPGGDVGQGPIQQQGGTDDPASQFHRRLYAVPNSAGTITVQFSAYCFPNRFQLWAPLCNAQGAMIAGRIIKRDTGYRGDSSNDCADAKANANPPCDEQPEGAGSGTMTWAKPSGITCIEVSVISPCHDGESEAGQNNPLPGWEYTISFTANPAP